MNEGGIKIKKQIIDKITKPLRVGVTCMIWLTWKRKGLVLTISYEGFPPAPSGSALNIGTYAESRRYVYSFFWLILAFWHMITYKILFGPPPVHLFSLDVFASRGQKRLKGGKSEKSIFHFSWKQMKESSEMGKRPFGPPPPLNRFLPTYFKCVFTYQTQY